MGALYPYGQLVRSAAQTRIACIPRRTLATTAVRCAQNDNNSTTEKPSVFSSVKSWLSGSSSKDSPKKAQAVRTPTAPTPGSLGETSIFADEPSMAGPAPKKKKQQGAVAGGATEAVPLEERDKAYLQPTLNPNPRAQYRWEKKMIEREVRKRGRVSKEVKIMRTERESLSKSHWFKTSLKKLGPLARQIAGKNIDEAILQMRFSKKKAAKDVLGHLEHAKNVAMVRAGMGLPDSDNKNESSKPITVVLKSGERKKINDPTSIYIQQAWVNRGPYGQGMDHRARGQINQLRPPSTGLSVLLKEEKTRIREWEEREAKAARQRKEQLWTQLPDRKISAQNQYYSW
ncbi:hypothetical protein N7468_004734 [Penicillium chermesinum]|uniref:Ribosomal protein L22 n=1 Tax=Penicillium chermesinum TaxID=63820 RepID=A0A9W9TSU1_9EURO|nr:uncharacterized protein N7468_004734 [Penicillium chermesinum]KAJ5240115.1 hypothetical protein N7468_004734 [Penicillium chermesinum]KAJ6166993.1 hypothetical protein N7470_002440 [Penicillium chermesinum]